MKMSLSRRVGAEFIGTFWLFVGCGSAVPAAGFSRLVWLFWLAPIVGGVLGGLLYRGLISGAAVAAGSLQLTEPDRGLKRAAHEMKRAG
jgi:glycerol uptake facilitator-like aquaporin